MMHHVMQLLKSESQDQFEERYMTFSAKWGKLFLEYFEAQKDELMKCATRYNIDLGTYIILIQE